MNENLLWRCWYNEKEVCKNVLLQTFFFSTESFYIFKTKTKKKIKKKKEKRETHVQAKCTPYQNTKDHGYIKMST